MVIRDRGVRMTGLDTSISLPRAKSLSLREIDKDGKTSCYDEKDIRGRFVSSMSDQTTV